MKIKQASMAMLGIMAIAGMFAQAHAVDATWSGAGADDNWSTGDNWFGGDVPAASSILLFDGDTRLTPFNDLASERNVNGIIFGASAGAYQLDGNTIRLSSSEGIQSFSAETQTLNVDLLFSGNRYIDARVGDIVINGAHSQVATLGGIWKKGIAELIMTGTNTATGVTRIYQGGVHYDLTQGGDFATAGFWLGDAQDAERGNSPTLRITASNAASLDKTLNNGIGNFGNSASRIILDANGGPGIDITSDTLSRTGNATYNVDLSSGDSALKVNSPSSVSGGIVRGGTVTDAGGITGFAAFDVDGYIHRNTNTEELTAESEGGTSVNFHVSGNVHVPGFKTANSLTITGAGSLSGGSLWGDVLMQEGVGDFTISKPMARMEILHQYSIDGILIFADGGQILGTDDTRSFSKTGPGAVLLSDTAATSSYTGRTNIQQGEFILDGSLSRTSGVHVYSGAVLSGSGSIGATDASSLTVLAGGTLSAAATGALDVNGTVTLDPYAHFGFTLDQLEGEALVANGAITLNDNDLQLLLETVPVLYQDELLMQGDSITGIFATINGDAFGPGNTFSLEYDSVLYDFQLLQTADSIYVTAIPEPAHAVVILLLLCAGFVLIRRRRQRA